MSATAAATLEAQRTELVSRIETAARAALGMPERDPGDATQKRLIHRFERFAAREGDLRKHYMHGALLVGGHVRRIATIAIVGDADFTRTVHRWRILLFMALNDPDVKPGDSSDPASEIVFDALLECVRAEFRTDDALFEDDDPAAELLAETTRYEGRQGFQIDASELVMFAGVLCHRAQCSILTVCSEAMGVEATDDFETAGLDFTNFSQDQRYLDGAQADVGARAPPADDPDHDFEDVTTVRPQT